WFASQHKFTCRIEEQSKTELNKCLQMFYASARQKNGSHFKVSSLKAIRAAIDHFLRQHPNNKPWSIVGDPEFNKCKDMMKRAQITPVVHKVPITSEQMQELYKAQQLGEVTTTNPAQLLRTAWFYRLHCTLANVAEKINGNLTNKCWCFDTLRREGDTMSSVAVAVHEKPPRRA
ncbi:hypothetical protein OS493_038493, partial [Desmophyllum pertusum]